MKEILKFCIAGGLTFTIDFSLLYLFTDIFGIDYLYSTAIAFTIAVIINYFLCLRVVFVDANNSSKQFIIFVVLSIGGLLLNQLCMWAFVEYIEIHYLISKVIATVIVTVWNYVTKKLALSR